MRWLRDRGQLTIGIGNELEAAIAFYGRQPIASDVPKIATSLILHYAEEDTWVNAGILTNENSLRANRKGYEIFIYDGT